MVVSTSFEDYRPKNVDTLTDADLHERAQVVATTLRWWATAHNDATTYHEQFRGYCPHCLEDQKNDS